ncbi:MAG: helix-turn-helix transcriptional regulator [Synergistaceae bacterium]|nr:helix-turn-helix transcriptional regulator [Synergistaceae bacterium]MBQ7168415.1 helix-turn-helix transcriptional regulator [Synergistaceae bacterium]
MIDGNLIKALRREKGLSQEELGGLVGTEGNLVSRWERGASIPSPTTCRDYPKYSTDQ